MPVLVADKSFSVTTSLTKSFKPGSIMGEIPEFTKSTVSEFTSTPNTLKPFFANNEAVGSPICPKPNNAIL